MINFEDLVLGPCMDAFARPATFYPDASQPGAPAFDRRGVWKRKSADVPIMDDGVLDTDTLTLGIRNSEFTVVPGAGDRVFIPAHMSLPAVGMCVIDSGDDDGQGGSVLVLKMLSP